MIEIAKQIEEKVKTKDGTWIDWQYLNKAGELLRRCRYTLQYTYPYAYYMCKGARKELVSLLPIKKIPEFSQHIFFVV